MSPRTIRVAVAGLGVVGRETTRLLLQSGPRLEERLGARIVLDAVCDRQVASEARALRLPSSVFRARDPRALLSRPGLDVIVELLGGLEAPRALVLAALRSGRHVVTANKRLLSHCWPQLSEARRGGARLYFEASVAGGIPILRALDQSLAADRIDAVYGILNGTTNYILTRVEDGASPQEALAEAQRLGFAEKDPSLDLSGRDTAQKVSVLAALLTGAWVPPGKIARAGIESLEASDVAFARRQLGRCVRLIGELRLDWAGGRLEAHVFPTLVPLSHPLAAVRRQYNAVLVKAASAQDLMFYGQGAGAGPTASAVLGDLFALAQDILGGAPPRRLPAAPSALAPVEDSMAPFCLRLEAQDRPGVLARVTAALAKRRISIASIHQPRSGRSSVPVVLTTHPARHGDFHRALGEILRLPGVSRRHAVMRMLEDHA